MTSLDDELAAIEEAVSYSYDNKMNFKRSVQNCKVCESKCQVTPVARRVGSGPNILDTPLSITEYLAMFISGISAQ